MSFDNFSAGVLEQSTQRLQELMKTTVEGRGWPQEVIDRLRIEAAEGDVKLIVPEEMMETVSNLEYGVPGQSSKAALREYSYTLDLTIASILESHGVDELLRRGVFQ